MAAYGCMRALSTVLDSVSSMSTLFPELEAILFPLMQRLTSTEGQDVFEEVLELISYFTYFSPSVSVATHGVWAPYEQCCDKNVPRKGRCAVPGPPASARQHLYQPSKGKKLRS